MSLGGAEALGPRVAELGQPENGAKGLRIGQGPGLGLADRDHGHTAERNARQAVSQFGANQLCF
jgi:hypothetical protein